MQLERLYDESDARIHPFSRGACKCHEPLEILMTKQIRRDFPIFKVDKLSRPTSGSSHELISRPSNFASAGFSCRRRCLTRNMRVGPYN